MIHIYLCEDDKSQLKLWESIVEKYLMINATDIRLYCSVSKPEELLFARRRSNVTGLYFLDIDLQAKINGIELAQEIRKYDPRGYIVFVTTHNEMALITFRYKVEAMDFIVKDQVESLAEQFYGCIENAENNYKFQLGSLNSRLSVKIDKASLVLDQNDIIAITTGDSYHTLTIHTKTGIRQITGTLKEFQKTMNSEFCQCSRSSVINMKHVLKFSREKALITMDNKETYSVSVRMMGKVQKALDSFH